MSQIRVLNTWLLSKYNLLYNWRQWSDNSAGWGQGGWMEGQENVLATHLRSPRPPCGALSQLGSEPGCQAHLPCSSLLAASVRTYFYSEKSSPSPCCKMGSHFAQNDTLPSSSRHPVLWLMVKSQHLFLKPMELLEMLRSRTKHWGHPVNVTPLHRAGDTGNKALSSPQIRGQTRWF